MADGKDGILVTLHHCETANVFSTYLLSFLLVKKFFKLVTSGKINQAVNWMRRKYVNVFGSLSFVHCSMWIIIQRRIL